MSASTRTFGGRYAVIERAGTGGMAEVYKARDELLGREVAVKVLSERLSHETSFVERFRREAQAAANLSHPNIVSLYDYGADDGTYFIVMEFIDGRPLADVIREEGALMPERAAEIASDVAQALERAHVAGLVHRDIKPSNIMFTSNGQTKVTDFGIARALTTDGDQTVTQTGMVIGTAAYLSPEQAQGNPLDARSDVYAVGCVLYEMLTGRPPFSGDSPLTIAYKHVREDPAPPSSKNPDVPGELDAIVMKALAKNADNRYSSAIELHQDLQRFLSGQRVTATPVLAGETMVASPSTRDTQIIRDATLERPTPAPAPRRRGAGFYILLSLLILALFGLLAWFLFNNLMGEPVTVPRVIGMDVEEARDRLEQRGLEADVERRFSKKPINVVINQDPEPGASVDEGATVILTVSKGPRQTTVPDVVDQRLRKAKRDLRDADLEVGEVTRQASDAVAANHVISTSPSAGETVDAGTPVDLVVSSGPAAVTVPFVEGQTEEDAVANIEAANLEADVDRGPSDEVPEGEVISQDPEGGTQAAPGSTVSIVVSTGPEEREMPDVTGQDADDAKAMLEDDFGLNVTLTEEEEECAQPPGTVCRQEPEPGAAVTPGDDVTLFVMPEGDGD